MRFFRVVFCLVFLGGCFTSATAGGARPASWATPVPAHAGLPNLHRVSSVLYRSAQPTRDGFAFLETQPLSASEPPIKTVVSLRAFHDDARYVPTSSHLQIEQISFKAWHPEDEDLIKFLRIVSTPALQPVLVHCQHGSDRTGMMVAMYRIAYEGWSKSDAIEEMISGGYGYHPLWQNLLDYIQAVDVDAIKQRVAAQGPWPSNPARAPTLSMAEILAASAPTDWRTLDPNNTLYVDLPTGTAVIELAPQFAPRHVDNVRTLVREHYFDGLAITRVQDNFVVQWSDPDGQRSVGSAARTLAAEFARPLAGLDFQALPDTDAYAPETGFSAGIPAARDTESGEAWAVHCYGALGAGRDDAADSGGGTELYVVIGHAPRQLDRNVTLLGRVVQGMELLAALPRGLAAAGMYEKPEQRIPIARIRSAADVPEPERIPLQLLRTDTDTFRALIEARRNRTESWYKVQAGHIDVCNVPLPVRLRAN